jgi:hypothetical protein
MGLQKLKNTLLGRIVVNPSTPWVGIRHDWCSASLLRVSYPSLDRDNNVTGHAGKDCYLYPCIRLELKGGIF